MKSIILIGDRGSGKTTMGQLFAGKFGMTFIDLDEKITEYIQSIGGRSIASYVEKNGWMAFREI
jgi:shikimate kinase